MADKSCPDRPPPAKRTKPDLGSTFDVLVGTNKLQQRFTSHTDLFIPRSQFFKAAQSLAWRTSVMQPTKLLNDGPEVFTNYMRCVYLGDVSPLLKGQNWSEKGSQVHFQALIMVFVLADRLCDLLTANIVTAEIIDYSDRMGMLPDSTATNLVYASTASTNPLRALMRDYCVYEAGNVQFAGEMSSKYHTEFFPDVVVEHVKIKSKSLESTTTTTVKTAFDVAVSTIEKCKYHQHDENFPSCSSIIRLCFVHLAPDL